MKQAAAGVVLAMLAACGGPSKQERAAEAKRPAALDPRLTPFGGVIGASQTREGNAPAYGGGFSGTW